MFLLPSTRTAAVLRPSTISGCSRLYRICVPLHVPVHPHRRWQSSGRPQSKAGTTFGRVESKTDEALPTCSKAHCKRSSSDTVSALLALTSSRISRRTGALPELEIKTPAPEGFYKYYLRDNERKSFAQPGAWISKLDFDAIRASLPDSLHAQPLDFFSRRDSSRNLLTAQACLELHLLQSTDHHKDDFEKLHPGRQALAWLLKGYDDADLSANVGFLRAMVHCLVAEGHERRVWDWLSIRHCPKVLSSNPKFDRTMWRGGTLRFLVESQACCSKAPGGINTSLRSLQHALSIDDREGPNFIYTKPAGIWIKKQLLHNDASTTADPGLFDWFVDSIKIWSRGPVEIAWERSDLLRRHPASPSPLPALEFLQFCYTAEPRSEYFNKLMQTWTGYGYLARTALDLNKQGFAAEARWVLDLGRECMPEFWTMKVRRNDPKNPGVDFGESASHPKVRDLKWNERRDRRLEYMRTRSRSFD